MIKKYKLFTTPMCPNCPMVKEFMASSGMEGSMVDASKPEGLDEARKSSVSSVPTVIFLDENDHEVARAGSIGEIKKVLENKQ